MSRKAIMKEVNAIVCDFCDKEIDVEADGYCYQTINQNRDMIKANEHRVTHLLFSWLSPTKLATSEYIRYDFHPGCFDKLFVKFLAINKRPHGADGVKR